MLFYIIVISLIGLLLSFLFIIIFLFTIKSRVEAIPASRYNDMTGHELKENIENISKYSKSGRWYFIFSIFLTVTLWLFWYLVVGDNVMLRLNVTLPLEEINKIFAEVLSFIFLFLFFSTNWVIIKFNNDSLKIIKNTSNLNGTDKTKLISILNSAIMNYGIYLILFAFYLVPIFTILK